MISLFCNSMILNSALYIQVISPHPPTPSQPPLPLPTHLLSITTYSCSDPSETIAGGRFLFAIIATVILTGFTTMIFEKNNIK